MSQTRLLDKKLHPELLVDLILPGWDTQQHYAFFEGIKAHGLKKLKRLQRFVGTKTREDVRIAIELYKKELRNCEFFNEIEQKIERACVSIENYITWLKSNMASIKIAGAGRKFPVTIFDPQVSPLPPSYQLSFPNWSNEDIQDFIAATELTKIITDISSHVPTKTTLEIKAAKNALDLICGVINSAIRHNHSLPTYNDLKPGYIYLQCAVSARKDNRKLKNLKIASNADPDMARAEFVLKKWLMPEIGTLPKGWTKKEKYALIVAIEKYGKNDILSIESYLKRSNLKEVISAYLTEVECQKKSTNKPSCAKLISVTSWCKTMAQCKEHTQKILAGKRLIYALEELPRPKKQLDLLNLPITNMTKEELALVSLNVDMQVNVQASLLLIPQVKECVHEAQLALCEEIRQSFMRI